MQLAEGSYYTACKKGMVGNPTDLKKFTVTAGKKAATSQSESKQIAGAVTNYISYIKDQSGQLLSATQKFAAAYIAGDDAAARAQYPAARMFYERIEPTAEQFGDIDPAIDLREADLEQGQTWTGWHRIEKDLWAPAGYTAATPAERKQLADQLVSDTQRLYDLVYAKTFTLTIDQISNGAIGLMEEVSRSKITGEEETFSHTDLWDFQANVEGAERRLRHRPRHRFGQGCRRQERREAARRRVRGHHSAPRQVQERERLRVCTRRSPPPRSKSSPTR